jgi:cytochrome c-type biogenesis protein CcsB
VSIADISNNLFTATVLLYSVAMLCFAAEFAFGRRGPVATAARVREPVLRAAVPVTVGAGGPAVDAPVVPPQPTPGTGGAPRRVLADRFGRVAFSVVVVGWCVHVAEVVTRGLAVHRLPWGNMYEFSTMVCLVAVGAFIGLSLRYRLRWLGLFLLIPVVLYLGLAGTVLYVPAGPLVPALNSYWLGIHVTAALTATGTFMVAGVVSCLHLVRRRYERQLAAGRTGSRVARRLPSVATLDRTEYRIIAFAFPLWTFAIIAGAIWAESAWGRYWGWDPKETWSFIVWVIYAAYLHARTTTGWRRFAPAVALVGFGALLFNYYVINLIVTGLHSYAGI